MLSAWVLVLASVSWHGMTSLPMENKEACAAAMHDIGWTARGYCINTKTGEVIK